MEGEDFYGCSAIRWLCCGAVSRDWLCSDRLRIPGCRASKSSWIYL